MQHILDVKFIARQERRVRAAERAYLIMENGNIIFVELATSCQQGQFRTCFGIEGSKALLRSLALGASVVRVSVSKGQRVACTYPNLNTCRKTRQQDEPGTMKTNRHSM